MSFYRRILRPLIGDYAFLVAAILLATTAIGWQGAKEFLHFVTRKEPVPWPKGVQVAQKDHRLLTLGDSSGRLGSYFFVYDHEFTENEKDTQNKLGIATDWDKSQGRWDTGRSNWYSIRQYEDPITKDRWQVSIYYYTGGLDLVPHIPDVCLAAGGNTIVGTDEVPLAPVDGHAEWSNPSATRTTFQGDDHQQRAIYYLFSFNGVPKHSRESVRIGLNNPLERYVYFAKIEFSSFSPIDTLQESDRLAREFAKILLPEVLKVLPSADSVQGLTGKP